KFNKDLKALGDKNSINLSDIKTPKYQKEYIEYQQKQSELRTRLSIKQKDYDRNKIVVKKGVISQSEFETIEFEYQLAKNNIYQYKKQQQNTWQASLTETKNQLKSLLSEDRKSVV